MAISVGEYSIAIKLLADNRIINTDKHEVRFYSADWSFWVIVLAPVRSTLSTESGSAGKHQTQRSLMLLGGT